MPSGKLAEPDADHGEADEGGDPAVPLKIAGEAAIAADLAVGALDSPARGHDNDAMPVAAAHDLQRPSGRFQHARPAMHACRRLPGDAVPSCAQ